MYPHFYKFSDWRKGQEHCHHRLPWSKRYWCWRKTQPWWLYLSWAERLLAFFWTKFFLRSLLVQYFRQKNALWFCWPCSMSIRCRIDCSCPRQLKCCFQSHLCYRPLKVFSAFPPQPKLLELVHLLVCFQIRCEQSFSCASDRKIRTAQGTGKNVRWNQTGHQRSYLIASHRYGQILIFRLLFAKRVGAMLGRDSLR